MVLDMTNVVKPFKILNVRVEQEGNHGVDVEVSKSTYINEELTKTVKMTTYVSVPKDDDIDNFLFNYLSKGGWF